MRIILTTGPTVSDPADQIRIIVDDGPGTTPIQLASIGFLIRAAVWYVRRYVADALSAGY